MTDKFDAAANRQARDAQKTAHLRRIYDGHLARCRAVARQADMPAVARDLHQVMDDVLARDRGRDPASGDIQCGRGCSHCCHGPVEIGPHEAALLVRGARETGVPLNRPLLERQSRYTAATWRQQPPADRACVFLGSNGACTVYAHRPGACRKLLVVTDPAFCNALPAKSGRVGQWISWEAEMMASAALEVFGSAILPGALLHELRTGDE